MNDERFFELAMKVIASQATDAERAELDARLAGEPTLRAEFERLQADVRVAKEALPLVEATQATAGELPAYARGRLQTKVRQVLRKSQTTTPQSREGFATILSDLGERALARPRECSFPPVQSPPQAPPISPPQGSLWRWVLGLATATAVVLLVALPMFRAPTAPVIELAMLDVAGDTRGGETNEVALLQQTWANAKLDSFVKPELLRAWETNWPGKADAVKIIYDRNAAEVRVLGRWHGKAFQNAFPVETDLALALTRAQAFIQQQSKP